MKRRVLEKFKLNEISGVDRPCQEHARVTIMKRAPEGSVDALSVRLAKLKEQVGKVRGKLPLPAKVYGKHPVKCPVDKSLAAQDQASVAMVKFWTLAARMAAIAARQRLGSAVNTVRLAATRGKMNPFGHAARAGARRSVARAGVTTAAVGGAAGTSHYYRRREALEERDRKRKGS